jgi:thioredoxin 1
MQSDATNIIHPTTSTFDSEVGQAGVPVLVDFWAPWCPPCRALKPELQKLASEVGDKAKFAFINVDDEPQLASEFGVSGIPALMIVKDGEVVDSWTGYAPRAAVLARLEKFLDGK